eukprot:CAMPEP_0184651166 /NCGR_PEP_ID=MMETSP0308-20130426/8745_1 /TAXON_ID=38269 /ORGANISM="Gloeochaete witrockiana, Strain SAG 46.84" /LENGTH=204 /DNA_ID=CAMNT_0027085185 /DNA_START=75 /DNA_END=689 /DNA_ORIENTATION=+
MSDRKPYVSFLPNDVTSGIVANPLLYVGLLGFVVAGLYWYESQYPSTATYPGYTEPPVILLDMSEDTKAKIRKHIDRLTPLMGFVCGSSILAILIPLLGLVPCLLAALVLFSSKPHQSTFLLWYTDKSVRERQRSLHSQLEGVMAPKWVSQTLGRVWGPVEVSFKDVEMHEVVFARIAVVRPMSGSEAEQKHFLGLLGQWYPLD